jgi:hypothetical protein
VVFYRLSMINSSAITHKVWEACIPLC